MNVGLRRPLLFAAAGAGLLASSLIALRFPASQRADVRAGDALREAGSPTVDRTVVATTDLGSLYAVGSTAGTLALWGERRSAADVLVVGALAWTVSQSAKTRVQRVRPYDAEGNRRLLRPPTGSSFPSGHATVAAALSAVLAERVPARAGRRGLLLLGPYVAFTRVYAGVHYPTDVLGGLGMGYLLAACWRGPVARGGRKAVSGIGAAASAARRPVAALARAVAGGPRQRRS